MSRVRFIALTHPARRVRLVGDLLLPILFCVPLLLAILFYHPIRKTMLMMNAAQMVLPLDGFFVLERFPNSIYGFRWMQDQGTIELPNPGGMVQLRLTLNGMMVANQLKQGFAGRSIRYATTLSLCLLAPLLLYGIILNMQLWNTDLSQEDIAFIWRDGSQIAQGVNPYARVESVIISGNNKFSTYFPLFYLIVALTNKLGVSTFSAFIDLWRYVCLAFNLLIAVLIYYGLARRSYALLGVFFAGIWLFNIWSLYVAQVLQIDFLPIGFLLLSIMLFDRQRR